MSIDEQVMALVPGQSAETIPIDWATLATERLEAELVGCAGFEAAAKARFLAGLAEFVRRRAWESWECVSAVQWLSWKCGLGRVAASEHLRVAAALEDLPAVAAGLASGRLSWSKVRAVTRVATAATDGAWAELAAGGTAAHVETIVAAQRKISADQVDRQHETRSLTWRQDLDGDGDGSVVLCWRVPAETGAALIAALNEATVPTKDVPVAVSRSDALAGLVLGDEVATPAVVIEVDGTRLEGGLGRCVSGDGVVVADETAAVACCDGPVTITQHSDCDAETGTEAGTEPVVVDRGRFPTRRTRAQLAARDKTCRFPGCHNSGRLEAHHVLHWIHGGARKLTNMVLVCGAHHRLIGVRLVWSDGRSASLWPLTRLFVVRLP